MQPDLNIRELYLFVMEKATDVSPEKRARLYRTLAAVIGSVAEARSLIALAIECEQLDRNCAQLALDFKRRAS
jgi:hypothetical protein